MPTYDYKCPNCERKREVFKPLAKLDSVEICEPCQGSMYRCLSAPMVIGDYAGYDCPITGKWIEGRKAHEANLKLHGCRVLEPGETEGAKRGFAKRDADLDAAVEATAEEFVLNLPTEKREQLAVELEQGADVTVTRK